MSIWPTHPKPKEGELLSSWLVRLASEFVMPATSFCSEILSIKSVNLRLMDRSPDNSLLQALSSGTGVPIERIRETSLLAEDGYLFSHSGLGTDRWIMPALTAHSAKIKYSTGMAYCPECLRTDHTPYYRKNWRYAFYAICPAHRIPLRNSCPHCGGPYSHMQPVLQTEANIVNPVTTCWTCGKDVRKVSSDNPWGGDLPDLTLSIQENILTGISRGAFDVPGHGYVYSRSYMDTLYCLIRALTEWGEMTGRMKLAGKMSGIEYQQHQAKPNKPFKDSDVELMQAEDRAILLCFADWLMGEWPTRLVAYAGKSKLGYTKLFGVMDEPFWFVKSPVPVSGRHLSSCNPTNDEIITATNMLRKMVGRAISSYEVSEFMKYGSLAPQLKKQIAAKKTAREWHQSFVREWEADLKAAKNKRLARAITISQSKKFLAKIQSTQKPSTDKPHQSALNFGEPEQS